MASYNTFNPLNKIWSLLVLMLGLVSPVELSAQTTVANTVTMLAVADDGAGCGVAYVQFKLDGTDLGARLTTIPYTFAWDSRSVPNGPHMLQAMAADRAGPSCDGTEPNIGMSNVITMNVQNNLDHTPPTIELYVNGVRVASGEGPSLAYLLTIPRITPPQEQKRTIEVRVK